MPINFKKPDGSVAKMDLPAAPEEVEEVAPVTEKKDKNKGLPSPVHAKLSDILAAVQKEKGEGLIMAGSHVPDMDRIPTGVFEFDYATGGGLPEGRMVIIYGPESSGKTNLSLRAVANVQRRTNKPNKAVFVDLEGTFDPSWAEKLGVITDDLVVVKPGYGEEAVDVIDAVVRADDVGIIVIDSIAVLTAAREVDKSVETADMATAAMLVKRLCNKLAIAFSMESRKGHFPTVVMLNQTRMKPGVMFGDPETMPGGMTMKFLSSLTVRLYGKNVVAKEIHPHLPAWKDTNVVIKKAKCPIVANQFTYKMAMIPVGDLPVGETDSWNTVSNYLKSFNLLTKEKDGWQLKGDPMVWKTLAPIEEQYICDNNFKLKLQQMVVSSTNAKFLIEAKDAAK